MDPHTSNAKLLHEQQGTCIRNADTRIHDAREHRHCLCTEQDAIVSALYFVLLLPAVYRHKRLLLPIDGECSA